MDDKVQITGQVRGIDIDRIYPTDDFQQICLSGQGDQLHAMSAAPYAEISRLGRTYWTNTTTAVATVVAMPTTAQIISIFNNEPDGGRSYIINQVWAMFVASTGSIAHASLVACLGQVREATPAQAAIVMKNVDGFQKFDTQVRVIIAATALPSTTGFAGNWFPVTDAINACVTSLPGFQKVFNIDGRYIVPPGRYFALHAVSNVTNVTAQVGISWTEKLLQLG